ncbi:MAG: hypothetical protein ACE5D7_05705, partial [Fidelibacterota bacterium]
MKKITAIFTIFSILIGVFGCDNPVKNNDKNSNQGNTLNDSSLNDNFIGSISEYFYDFENDINVKFYRWDISTINQPILFDETTDTMNFRTFPEYLLSIEPGEIGEPFTDTNNNGQYDPGEPFIDQGNGLWELGEPFTDANNNGFFDQGETFEDVNGDGQWTGTERLYDVNGDCLWNDAETFEDWNADGLWTPAEPLSNEYINFGTWDPHEPYEDLNGNGMYDWREPFTDTNGDGTWTPQEPYEDLNGNGQWDDAEPYVELWGSFVGDFLSDGTALDIVACGCTHLGPNMNFHCGENGVYNPECGDTFLDTDGDGERDSAEPFEDIYPPFGEYNPDEQFDDWNGDGIWTAEDEPFTNLNPNAPGIPVWNDDEEFVDWNNDGEWTPAEPLLFEYHSNGIWDDAELFEDLDNDGIWDNEGEQFDDEDGDCLWSIGETFLDQPDDPSVAEWNSFTESHQLVNETLTKNTSVNITSSQIRHLNQLFWDFDLERYTPVVSDWDVKDTTLYFSDPYDSLIYQQSVTSLPSGNNSYYIDRSEWIGTSYVYTSGDSLFSITFHLKQKMVGADSLMYRRHADCNLNGIADPAEDFTDVNGNNQYDIGEPFVDLPNDMLDAAEPFLDRDLAGEPGYGVRNLDEPFLDLNCNNQWDPAETVDQGNGQWDDAEPEDLFYRTMEPNNLVVSFDNYPDLSNPRILMTINSEEWFSDCGIDNICPTDEDYEEPDTGEGNGLLDDGE